VDLSPIPRDFYCRPAEVVAAELLGRLLVRYVSEHRLIIRIVETEAYLGEGDRASHAWRGKPTRRTKTLFRSGGCCYVYLVYGIHHMFNVVTGETGDGSAVLVRAGEPVEGEAWMQRNRGLTADSRGGDVAGGPGRLCQALQIDLTMDGLWLDGEEIVVAGGTSVSPDRVSVGSRIGVSYAGEAAQWPLRFAEVGNPHVSRPRPW
jgi:DNA-3-methyladenine glycosylase